MYKVSTKEEDSEFKTKTNIIVGTIQTKEWNDKSGKSHLIHSVTNGAGVNIERKTENNDGTFRLTFKVEGDKKSENSYTLLLTDQYITVGRN